MANLKKKDRQKIDMAKLLLLTQGRDIRETVDPQKFDELLKQIYEEGAKPDISEEGMYSDAYIARRHVERENNIEATMATIEHVLHLHQDEFDVVVVSGLSGIVPAAIYCYKYQKQLVVIRKDDDITHGVRTEGHDYFVPGTPYVVIDDMVSTGRTMNRIFSKMWELGHPLPVYVVIYNGHMHPPIEIGWENEELPFWIHFHRFKNMDHIYTVTYNRDDYGAAPVEWTPGPVDHAGKPMDDHRGMPITKDQTKGKELGI